jgi:hypothetical protein
MLFSHLVSTNEADDEIEDDFYEQLQTTISKVPLYDMLLIMGDMNAKVGVDNTGCERMIAICLCDLSTGWFDH